MLLHDRAGTNNIVNLQTEREEKQIGLAGSARKTHYQWGGDTQVDLAVGTRIMGLIRLQWNQLQTESLRMIDVYKGSLTRAWHLNSAGTIPLKSSLN